MISKEEIDDEPKRESYNYSELPPTEVGGFQSLSSP